MRLIKKFRLNNVKFGFDLFFSIGSKQKSNTFDCEQERKLKVQKKKKYEEKTNQNVKFKGFFLLFFIDKWINGIMRMFLVLLINHGGEMSYIIFTHKFLVSYLILI